MAGKSLRSGAANSRAIVGFRLKSRNIPKRTHGSGQIAVLADRQHFIGAAQAAEPAVVVVEVVGNPRAPAHFHQVRRTGLLYQRTRGSGPSRSRALATVADERGSGDGQRLRFPPCPARKSRFK